MHAHWDQNVSHREKLRRVYFLKKRAIINVDDQQKGKGFFVAKETVFVSTNLSTMGCVI